MHLRAQLFLETSLQIVQLLPLVILTAEFVLVLALSSSKNVTQVWRNEGAATDAIHFVNRLGRYVTLKHWKILFNQQLDSLLSIPLRHFVISGNNTSELLVLHFKARNSRSGILEYFVLSLFLANSPCKSEIGLIFMCSSLVTSVIVCEFNKCCKYAIRTQVVNICYFGKTLTEAHAITMEQLTTHYT